MVSGWDPEIMMVYLGLFADGYIFAAWKSVVYGVL